MLHSAVSVVKNKVRSCKKRGCKRGENERGTIEKEKRRVMMELDRMMGEIVGELTRRERQALS